MPGFYTPNLTEKTETLLIEGEEYHHIVNVFRKKTNESILLTNGKGILSDGIIWKIEKNNLIVRIKNIQKFSHHKPDIMVAFSLLKHKNDFLIIEKLTELGIRRFFPIITQRTIKKPSRNLENRYIKTAISAIKQCDNAFLPKIDSPIKLTELFNMLKRENVTPFVAFESEKQKTFFDVYDNQDRICLIFGPEGGFADEEVALLKKLNIQTFTIGNHILRAETAAISASAIVINHFFEKNRRYY